MRGNTWRKRDGDSRLNKHTAYDLKQMQSLPLEAKIRMSQLRIKAWYESWVRYEIYNKATGKTRYVTAAEEPLLSEDEWIETATDGQVYVSFSGGKDSTVLKHLVENTPGVYNVPSLFVNTGLEYPEIQKFAMSQPNVITVRPEIRFDEVLRCYGYPVLSKENSLYIRQCQNPTENNLTTRKLRLEGIRSDGTKVTKGEIPDKWKYLVDAPFGISEKCCDVMKKSPAKKFAKETGRKPFIGTMASESRLRYTKWIQHGCNAFDKKDPSSQPMSFWTEQDVLHYIKKYNLPYCSVYSDIVVDTNADIPEGQMNFIDYLGEYEDGDRLKTTGCDRTGCIFCMFGCHLEKEPNRFQRLKATHPRQYDYCINGGEFVDGKWQPNKKGLGLGYVLDYIGVDYK